MKKNTSFLSIGLFHPGACVALAVLLGVCANAAAGTLVLSNRSGTVGDTTYRSANLSTVEQAYADGMASGLQFRTTSNDPRMVFVHQPVQAEEWKSLWVKFTRKPVHEGEQLEFYFITKADRRYGEDKEKRVPIPVRTGSTEVVIDLQSVPGWKGEVIETRLDFGQRANVTYLVEEVWYSTAEVPTQQSAAADDSLQQRIEAERSDPTWTGSDDEALILNTEYLVPLGREKPVLLPVSREDREGVANDTVAFDVWWSAAGSVKDVDGGWESALWWPRDMKSITFRYKVRQVQGNPELVVRLYERVAGVGLNNDAWVWKAPLKKTSHKDGWQEVALTRRSTEFRLTSEGTPEWELINYMTMTFLGKGHDGAEVIVESPLIHLNDGRTLKLWDPRRRYAHFDTVKAGAMAAPGEGRFLIGKGGSLLSSGNGRALLLDFKKWIPNVGLAANQDMVTLAAQSEWLRGNDIGLVYQQGGAYGLAEVISGAKAWSTNPSGISRTNFPGSFGMVGVMKYYDMTSLAIRKGFADVFDLTARAGVPEFQVIESYWPSVGGFWSGGEGSLARLRDSLAGRDSGLEWKTPAGTRRLHFRDFFKDANGFMMEPSRIGLQSWDEFGVPKLAGVRSAQTDAQRRHFFLMMNLARYEALKFYGDLGASATRSGVKLGTVINRENYDNSFDFLGLMAAPGVRAIGHEYFGNPSHSLEGAFEHGQVLQALSRASDTEVRAVVESNATGTSGRPYYDPQIAYAVSYALWAADRPGSVENDWLSWNAADLGTNGSAVQRERHADFVLKGLAYHHILQDDWKVAPSEKSFAIIRSRKLNDVGAVPGNHSELLQAEAWPRMRFDFSEARFLGDQLKTGRVLFGEWSHQTEADTQWLESWLEARGDRTLVMSGFRPGKAPDGANYSAFEMPAYVIMNSQSGFQKLMGGRVARIAGFAGRPRSDWLDDAELPERIELPAYYYLETAGQGTDVLVSLRGQPLVSRHVRANGSSVLYLHYDPSRETADLDRAILHRLAQESGIRRDVAGSEGLLVRRYEGTNGVLIAAFDRMWMHAFKFTYDPLAGLRMKWQWNGPERHVELRDDEQGAYVVDLVTGEVTDRKAGENKLVLNKVGGGLWVLAGDRKTADRLAARARLFQPLLQNFVEPAKPTATRSTVAPASVPVGQSRLMDNLKSGKKQTVVLFGTSLSRGGDWFPSWFQPVQEILDKKFPGQLTAINSAGSGQHSRWGLEVLDENVIAKAPDCMFIEFSINDAVARFDLSLDESRKNMNAMIDRIQTALPGCEIILQITNPVVGRPEGDRSHRREQEKYEQIYRDIARERKLVLIDNAPLWRAILEKKGEQSYRQFVPDGIHPIGSAYKAVTVSNILRTLGFSK
jgi:hypothetical protein